MKIGEINCKNIINYSRIQGIKYTLNPYVGCTHGCTYCYARFMTRWYHRGEKWGSFVDIKKNALECVEREAPLKKNGIILLSSVTDAYQPIEKNIELTRKILQILVEYDLPLEILTKSSLIYRDIDILESFNQLEVGLTLTSIDDRVRRTFEPGASSIKERLITLERFTDAGIPTYAFLGPLLPYLSSEKIEEMLNILADKVGKIIVDRLNIKAGNWRTIEDTILSSFPYLLPKFKKALEKDSKYYMELKNKIIYLLNERAIPYDILY